MNTAAHTCMADDRGGSRVHVTSSMMMRSTLRDLSQGLSRMQETQTQISTNKQLTRPSVNPERDLVGHGHGSRTCAARSSGCGRSTARAGLAVVCRWCVDLEPEDAMAFAKEIAVRAANTGAITDPVARQALSAEIRSIRSELLAYS